MGKEKILQAIMTAIEKHPNDAEKLLKLIDTPEVATALKGDHKEMYLKALDSVYGPKAKRAADMGFGNKTWYHGTTVPVDEFQKDALGASTNAASAKKGFFFAQDPSTASDYAELAREKGIIREGDKITTRAMSDTAELNNDAYDQVRDLSFEKNERLGQIARQQERNANTAAILSREPKDSERYPDLVAKLKQGENFINQWQTEASAFNKQIKSIDDTIGSTGQNVVPVRLKGDASNIHVKDYKGQGYRDSTYADEMTKAQDDGKTGVLFKNTYDPADPANRVKQNIAAVFEPNQIRSEYAAFDPRFKDSAKLLAGAGAMKQADVGLESSYKNFKKDIAEPLADGWEKAKSFVTEPLARQLDLTKDGSAREGIKQGLDIGLDPTNLLPGVPAAIAGGIQFMGSKDKGEVMKPEDQKRNDTLKMIGQSADKLYKGGMISEDTHKMITKKFASGGVVSSSPEMSSIPASLAPQNSSQATPAASPLDAILNQKVVDAQANTQAMAQAASPQGPAPEKSPSPYITDEEWNKTSPEQRLLIKDPTLAQSVLPSSYSGLKEKLSNFVGDAAAKGAAKDQATLQSVGLQGANEGPKEEMHLEKVQPGEAQAQRPDMMQMVGNMYRNQAGAYDKAFGEMKAGASAEAAAATKIAAAQTAAYTTAATDMAKFQEDQKALNLQRQQKLDEQNNKVQSMVDDFTKNATIDPNRYWANKSTGQKITAGLGVFFGGLGRNHGPNEALGIINNAINRDIDAQKAQVQTKATGINLANNVYKNMLDQFQDERAAEQATKLTMMNMLELNVKKLEAQNAGPMFAAKAQQAYGMIDKERAQIQGQFMQTLALSPQMRAGNEQMQNIMLTFKDPEMRKDALKELGEYQKTSKVKDNIQQSFEQLQKYRRYPPGTQGFQLYKSAEGNLEGYTKEYFEGKSEAEFDKILKLFPKGLDDDKTVENKLNMFKSRMDSQHSFPLLSGYGLLPKTLDLKRNK